MEEKNFFKNKKLWIVVVLIALIIGILCIFNNISEETNTDSMNEYSNMIGKEIQLTTKIKKDIYEETKNDVLETLKTPATANFPDIKDWNITVNYNNVIDVKSYVDSQNSYGATLRGNFKQQYVILNKNEYLCIYKEFNNETKFDITENSQFDKFINKKINKAEVDDVLKGSSIIYNKMSYNFNEETQELTLEITEEEKKSYNIRTSVYSCIIAEINQCFCMPTITMNIIVKNEEEEKLAEVNNIDFNFLMTKWNILADMGIMENTSFDELEEKLEEKLWQNNRIKEIDLKYINTNVFNY